MMTRSSEKKPIDTSSMRISQIRSFLSDSTSKDSLRSATNRGYRIPLRGGPATRFDPSSSNNMRFSSTPTPSKSDLEKQYKKHIRPLLDVVDKLRALKVMNEGIPLPSIVVVGDQSSGKSSVLESLATISLPRGQGIATRVPLVLRLQSCAPGESSITIQYGEQTHSITESEIESAVDAAQIVLAGKGKGVTDAPISLHIRKPNAPDLSLIDLPGITRVPVHGQPDDIYEQIAAMIRFYIKPKESVILNVLPATLDFSTCESIRMSQKEDMQGERTLAVVTKVDRAPEGLLQKVTVDAVNIGLGYICVRNRTGDDETHEEARERERELFANHPHLSQLDRDSVGISALAKRLTQIQAHKIKMLLPGIVQQIDKVLEERRRELAGLPKSVSSSEADASDVFLNITDEIKDLLENLMIKGAFHRYPDDIEMHYSARLDELMHSFSDSLHKPLQRITSKQNTRDIMERMKELRGLALPNFLSPTFFRTLVSEEIDKISESCRELVFSTHEYAKKFLIKIIDDSSSINSYPKLLAAYKEVAEMILEKSSQRCMDFVERTLTQERSMVFTTNDYYSASVKKIGEALKKAKMALLTFGNVAIIQDDLHTDTTTFAELENASNEYRAAWDMKVNLSAYWKVVHKRMADVIPMEILYSLESAILRSLRVELLKSKMNKGMNELMEEHASTKLKRTTLEQRIAVLQECKAIVKTITSSA